MKRRALPTAKQHRYLTKMAAGRVLKTAPSTTDPPKQRIWWSGGDDDDAECETPGTMRLWMRFMERRGWVLFTGTEWLLTPKGRRAKDRFEGRKPC
jgi:hypothetical protein